MENNLAQIKAVIEKMAAENEYMRFLGIEFLVLEEGRALGRIPYKKELVNPYGALHGGSLYSLADIVAGSAACMCGSYVTTVSGNMNFMSPAGNTEYVYCEALRLRVGKHLAVFEVKIRDEKDRLLDSGEFTFFVTSQKIV